MPADAKRATPAARGAKQNDADKDDDEEDDEAGDKAGTSEAAKDIKLGDEERLQKVIARAGLASRRGAEALIADGRVVVNGKLVIEAGTKVNPKKDMISVDGKKVVLPDAKSTIWVMVNKPKAVLTTMDDDKKDKERRTLMDLVPKARDLRLVPVGTMERDSTGLMLLTNDVGWIHPLTHHSFQQARRYEVVVGAFPEEASLEVLRKGGASLPDDAKLGLPPLRPATVNIIDVDNAGGLVLLDVTIDESRPQQVQRMLELVGCPVVGVKRTGFASLKLASLRRGQWREMTAAEVERLKASCRKAVVGAAAEAGVGVGVGKEDGSAEGSAPRRAGRKSPRKKPNPGAGYAARTEVLRAQGTKVESGARGARRGPGRSAPKPK